MLIRSTIYTKSSALIAVRRKALFVIVHIRYSHNNDIWNNSPCRISNFGLSGLRDPGTLHKWTIIIPRVACVNSFFFLQFLHSLRELH